jgi:hypothetical protein
LNPASCTPVGASTLHAVQAIMTASDCNLGFDLDGCDGQICQPGGLAPGEGLDGVDNALTGLGPVLAGVGGNLGGLDQAFYDELCSGGIDWQFLLDVNQAEGCANLTPIYYGVAGAPIPMNLSEGGCISGAIGTLPIDIAGVNGAFFNGTVIGTVDEDQGFELLLGATAEEDGAAALADAILPGAGAVVRQVLDINSNLEPNNADACDSISVSLVLGGTLVDQ